MYLQYCDWHKLTSPTFSLHSSWVLVARNPVILHRHRDGPQTTWKHRHAHYTHITFCVCVERRNRKMEVKWQFTIHFLHRRQGKSVRVCVCVRQTVTFNVSSRFLRKQRAWSVSAVLCHCGGSRWHLTTRAEFSGSGYNATHTHTHIHNKVQPSSLEFN